MADTNDALRTTLSKLHEQLAAADAVDPDVQARLHHTIDEIHAHLGEPAASEVPQRLTDQLAEMTQQFEETHPTLSEALRRVIDALANLGI